MHDAATRMQRKSEALRRSMGMGNLVTQPQKGSKKRKMQTANRRTSKQSEQISI
jgi:hypothetical protein